MGLIKIFNRTEYIKEIETLKNDLIALYELESELVGIGTIYNSLAQTQSRSNPLYGDYEAVPGTFLNHAHFSHRRKVVSILQGMLSLSGKVGYESLSGIKQIEMAIQNQFEQDFLGLEYCVDEFLECHFVGRNRHAIDLAFPSECKVSIEGVFSSVAPEYTSKLMNVLMSFKGEDARAYPLKPKYSDSLLNFENEDLSISFGQTFNEYDDALVNISLVVKNVELLDYLVKQTAKLNANNAMRLRYGNQAKLA